MHQKVWNKILHTIEGEGVRVPSGKGEVRRKENIHLSSMNFSALFICCTHKYVLLLWLYFKWAVGRMEGRESGAQDMEQIQEKREKVYTPGCSEISPGLSTEMRPVKHHPQPCQAWNASRVMTVTGLGTHQLKFNKWITNSTTKPQEQPGFFFPHWEA